MSNTRLTVVVRKDLQLPEGLLAAQVAHIANEFIRIKLLEDKDQAGAPSFYDYEWEWFEDPYLSVLATNCKEDLLEVIEHAKREKLSICCWEDTIPSPTFPNQVIKALVGVSIGPEDFDKIKIVTGGLPLY